MSALTFGSLFAGIGGIDLGLERAGFTCRWQVEINPDACRVLEKHWPTVPRFGDVRSVGAEQLERVDLIAGGFPCQPFSSAGQRRGIDDERWMWPEYARIVRELRPRFVLVENVAALLANVEAFGRVLADLHSLGFDAEWSVVSACSLGAPHTRERLFLVAYADGLDGEAWLRLRPERTGPLLEACDRPSAWADSDGGVMAHSGRGDRMPNGLSRRMVAAGGNAVVPAVAEFIGRRIREVA